MEVAPAPLPASVVLATSSEGGARYSAASLYEACIGTIVDSLDTKDAQDYIDILLQPLPDPLLVDLYFRMFEKKRKLLSPQLDFFFKVLKADDRRLKLLTHFQWFIVEGAGLHLAEAYDLKCVQYKLNPDRLDATRDYLIELGLRLGSFFNEGAWYIEAEVVLLSCRDLCLFGPKSPKCLSLTLECCHRLLHAQTANYCFPRVMETFSFTLLLLGITDEVQQLCQQKIADSPKPANTRCDVSPNSFNPLIGKRRERRKKSVYCKLVDEIPEPINDDEEMNNLLLRLYKEFAVLNYVRSDYKATYMWSTKALKLLKENTPPQISIDVLRISGKACVIMREFKRAGLLMQQAVALARQCFGYGHPRYAFTMRDYGLYLINVDSNLHSVTVYEEALAVLKSVFVGDSLHVAAVHEDLSYALYVHEYSSGRFFKAREHADKAIQIYENLLPSFHLMKATSKRVKALILEEIALDTPHSQEATMLLSESEELHRTALNITLLTFGEKNVQTARHYGNLGRLYQSMHNYQEAETMQLRAISIKEELLGADDYEVGLSIGHLASLYNYHMNMYTAAEKLYFRSIEINLKIFGERYSGLEYDYLGLVRVNQELKKPDRAQFFNECLENWRSLRNQPIDEEQPALGREITMSINDLKLSFFHQKEDEDD